MARRREAGLDDFSVIERGRRQGANGMPGGVRRQRRVKVGGHKTEVRGCELPLPRVPSWVAPRLELLEMRELADIHLRGEVAADRALERLPGLEVAARERPTALERLARPLPHQRLERVVPNLEDDGQRDVAGRRSRRLWHQV